MNYSNFFSPSLILIITGCKNLVENTNEKLKIIEDVDVNIKDEKILPNQNIEEEFKLTDENVINFLFEYEKNNKENKVRIYTNFGNIDILLFSNTPYHRSNFIYLTKKNYFDGTQFYRVVNNFVIQAGIVIIEKFHQKDKELESTFYQMILTRDTLIKGEWSVCQAAQLDNPYKMASPYEFFIVQKKDGAHHLDGNYTIFELLLMEWKLLILLQIYQQMKEIGL